MWALIEIVIFWPATKQFPMELWAETIVTLSAPVAWVAVIVTVGVAVVLPAVVDVNTGINVSVIVGVGVLVNVVVNVGVNVNDAVIVHVAVNVRVDVRVNDGVVVDVSVAVLLLPGVDVEIVCVGVGEKVAVGIWWTTNPDPPALSTAVFVTM